MKPAEYNLDFLVGQKVIFWCSNGNAAHWATSPSFLKYEKQMYYNDGGWIFYAHNPNDKNWKRMFSDMEWNDFIMVVLPDYPYKKQFKEFFGEFIEV